ncbi:MAG TPA: Crp/Fnr family transcriptional regulator [Saprospiraceae bacterium]|nr:Crp/Fnr family transcriptional regulator [Saprospiraceae bacterium]
MQDQSFWYLENVDMNGLFCANKLEGALKGKSFNSFKKGDYIYLPDQSSDKIYFIQSGKVKIGTFGDNQREITKAILGSGEIFGELSMIGEDKRRDFAYAMEDTNLCCMNNEEMKELMKDRSSVSMFMLKVMGSRVLNMENRLESLVFKDSRSRIVEFLVDEVEKKGQRIGYEYVLRGFLTHQEIANITATSRQTVTTLLNDLRNRNIITFDRRRLLVRDLDALKAEMV